jgi:hypothetical protein
MTRLASLAATCLLLASVLTVNIAAARPTQAADMPPNPPDKPGSTLDRHDEFNGSLDQSASGRGTNSGTCGSTTTSRPTTTTTR